MAFLADLYRVTAGGSHLRSFFTRDGAKRYALAVVQESHANVGCVRVEARDGLDGRWHVLMDMGAPSREG